MPRVTEANSAFCRIFSELCSDCLLCRYPYFHRRSCDDLIKECDIIEQRTLSGCFGRGDINHNNRSVITENVDREKIKNDIIICQRSLKQLYHECFDEALEEFNARQTRRDRKIPNYLEHIRHSRQEKEFYETIFQVGNREDTGMDSEMCQEAADVLRGYALSFQERNPHLKLFNAVIHMDESTPHLHLDFVPVCDEKRKNGMRVRNSLTGALRQQGFSGGGKSNTITMVWLEKEKEHIGQLMQEHGIEWIKLGTHEKHKSVSQYKADKLREEIDAAEVLISRRTQELSSAEEKLKTVGSEIAEQEQELSSVKEKISEVQDDLAKKEKKLTEILNMLPDTKRDKKLEDEYDDIRCKLKDMLKGSMSIIKHKDEIISFINKLFDIVKKALDIAYKYSKTIYELRNFSDQVIQERDDARARISELSQKNSELSRENQSVTTENAYLHELFNKIQQTSPSVLTTAKSSVIADRERRQLQQIQQNANKQQKKKYFGLE